MARWETRLPLKTAFNHREKKWGRVTVSPGAHAALDQVFVNGKLVQSVADVISTLEELTELPSKNTSASSLTREVAARAAEALAELVLCTLTTRMPPAQYEESCVRLVTRHFGSFGITPQSLEILRNILTNSRQLWL